MSNSTANQLTPAEVELLHDIARGLIRAQMCEKYHLTIGMLQGRLQRLYRNLGVFDRGKQTRAFALSVALDRFGLVLPPELEGPAQALMASIGGVQLSSEPELRPQDLALLLAFVLGHPRRLIARALGISRTAANARLEALKCRVGAKDEVELAVLAVNRHWVNVTASPALNRRARRIKKIGLSSVQLQVVRMFRDGRTYAQVKEVVQADLGLDMWQFMHHLYLSVGVNQLPSVVALVILADWPLAPSPPSPPLFSDLELELLQLLAEGLIGSEITARLDITQAIRDRCLSSLYAKLGTNNAYRAVALATRDGLIPQPFIDELATDFPSPDRFSFLYVAYLQLLASGKTIGRHYREIGSKSQTTFYRHTAADRRRSKLPVRTQMAIMVRLGRVKVFGPSVVAGS